MGMGSVDGARRNGKEEGKGGMGEGSTAYIFDASRALEIAEVIESPKDGSSIRCLPCSRV